MLSAASFIVILLIMLIIPTILYSFFFLINCPPNPFHLFRRRSLEAGASELGRSKVDDDNDLKDKYKDNKNNNMELIIMSSIKMGKETECPVCLSIFSEGEELRQLKICKHMFHKGCIDKWLSTHFSCPVCRAFVSNHLKHKEKQNVRSGVGSRNVDHGNDFWQGMPDAAGLV